MSDAPETLGDRLHRALATLRGEDLGLSPREAESRLLGIVRELVRRSVSHGDGVDDDLADDVTAVVVTELLLRPSYKGQHPGEAMNFVTQLIAWRLSTALRARGDAAEPLDEDTVAAETPGDRETLHAIDRACRVLLLLAGRSEQYRRVRAYLDHRLGLSDADASADRTVQNRLAQDRSTGRRYAMQLVAKHEASFDEDELALLRRLFAGAVLSAGGAEPRPDAEGEA